MESREKEFEKQFIERVNLKEEELKRREELVRFLLYIKIETSIYFTVIPSQPFTVSYRNDCKNTCSLKWSTTPGGQLHTVFA